MPRGGSLYNLKFKGIEIYYNSPDHNSEINKTLLYCHKFFMSRERRFTAIMLPNGQCII